MVIRDRLYLRRRELMGVEPNLEWGWLSRLFGRPASLSYRGHCQPSKVVN